MKCWFVVLALLSATALASESCAEQTLLGFEDAVFLTGAEVEENVQEVAAAMFARLEGSLTVIDTFVTPRTRYDLFRAGPTGSLVLMTSSEESVCLYHVPTENNAWPARSVS